MTVVSALTGPMVGLWMLLALGALIVTTGLPVWALLIGVASAFAAMGLTAGTMNLGILSALPSRIVGLLEHDLLQALPLYVFIGILLQRLTVADALFSSLARLFRPLGGAVANQSLAALGVGTLIAPMNGSVASSSALMSRLVAPRLGHMSSARATALISVSATIGVVVPPSLVLLLLGDAMMRAHTEASNLPDYLSSATLGVQRIINTQDVLHAALLPAMAVLLLWAVVAWWQGRAADSGSSSGSTKVSLAQGATAFIAATVIIGLLGSVFTGKLYAVEAAASGGVLLIGVTLLSRALTGAQWREVLLDTLSLSGALFALLVGATTFSLVFRLFGTDTLLAMQVMGSTLTPLATAALVLLLVALCAWVLDAFEMIFVIIPIVAPALIARLGDAQQAAVLLLLVLQLSFLIPPMGYAVLMVRARSGLPAVAAGQLLKALAPYVLAQIALVMIVFFVPALVHQLDEVPHAAPIASRGTDADVVRQIEEMANRAAEGDSAGAAPSVEQK